MHKRHLLIIAILCLALFLRVWTLSSPIFGDENPWPYAAADHSKAGFNFDIVRPYDLFVWTSPPLAPLAYRFFTWGIGVSEVTLRLVPLILGLLNIYLLYILAKRLFDEKVALLSAGIMAVSFWAILSSFLIEHDSSFMMTFWLLFFNAFALHEQTGKKSWLIWAAVAVLCAMLTKLTGALMVVVLGAYLFVKWVMKKEHPQKLLKPALLCAVLCVVALVPVLITYLISPSYLAETLAHTGVMTLVPEPFTFARILIYLSLWATPMLVGIALLSVADFDAKKKFSYAFLWSWVAVVLLFYLFTKYFGAIDRYMSVLIPALSVLAAATILRILDKNRIVKSIGIAIAFLGVLIVLNLVPSAYIVHDVADYLHRALTFQWTFLFPFTGGTGPAFLTSFMPLGVGLVACGSAFIITFILFLRKTAGAKHSSRRTAMMLFVGLCLGLNLFIVQAFILKAPYPDVGQTTRFMAGDIARNFPAVPLYATDVNLAWYVNRTQAFYPIGDVFSATPAQVAMLEENLSMGAGILAITDFPKHSPSDNIWKIVKDAKCMPIRTYGPRDITLGYLYYCPAWKNPALSRNP